MPYAWHTGYISKRGARRTNWARRYFELREGWLSYFASYVDPGVHCFGVNALASAGPHDVPLPALSPSATECLRRSQDGSPRGRIPLAHAQLVPEGARHGGASAFEIVTRTRTFYLRCEYEFDRPQWLADIANNIALATAENDAAGALWAVVRLQAACRRWRVRRALKGGP